MVLLIVDVVKVCVLVVALVKVVVAVALVVAEPWSVLLGAAKLR